MDTDPITSLKNPHIKFVRSLRQRKARRANKAFLVEGIRHVGEAVEAGSNLHSIYYAPDLLRSNYAQNLVESQSQAGVPCYATATHVFTTISEKDNPQGIMAVVGTQETALGDLTTENFPWGVALIAPADPGNLGAILRTIDAVGASGLILINNSVDPYHPTAVRASMGTLFWLPIVETRFPDFEVWQHEGKYTLYGTSAHADVEYRTAEYRTPSILLMGSERQGLTEEEKNSCDTVVCLPMHGQATSLNLAVATGIMLYEMKAKFGGSA